MPNYRERWDEASSHHSCLVPRVVVDRDLGFKRRLFYIRQRTLLRAVVARIHHVLQRSFFQRMPAFAEPS